MGYKINLGTWNSIFAVPAVITDRFLKLATGNNLKVLLYFLRHAGENITTEEISAASGIKTDDVEDAFLFWEQVGLLSENGQEFIPAEKSFNENAIKSISTPKSFEINTKMITDSTVDNVNINEMPMSAQISLKRIELNREPRFNPKEIARTVRGSEEVDYFFKQCEVLYGRPLKHNEQNSLMIIIEDTGIPVACALMLVEYCFSVNKATPAYIKSVAISWLDKEITTVEKAEEEIKRLKSFNIAENEIKKLFEINSALSKDQKNYIDKWVNTYGFSIEMIDEAYQISLNKAGKMSFPYMDKVINGWNEKSIKSKNQLILSEKQYKEKANINNNSANSSFDLDEVNRAIMEKYN